MTNLEPTRVGRWYRSLTDGRVFVLHIFGRGRNRQVVYQVENDPNTKHTVPARSFAQRFIKERD